MAEGVILPRVQTLVVCDTVLYSGGVEEGVFDLYRARTERSLPELPGQLIEMWVYLQVSGHVGIAPLRVEILRVATDDVVYATPDYDVEFLGPIGLQPLCIELENCGLPSPGVDYVQVYSGTKLLFERPFVINESQRLGNGHP
jgi:hypothetical protein